MSADIAAAQRAVHEALKLFLDDGEIPISWVLTIDVTGTNGVRYLAHRAGGGLDGIEHPAQWHAAGMLQASVDMARDQMRSSFVEDDDEDDE